MSEFGILVRDAVPKPDGTMEIGVVGPITQATTPALRRLLLRLIDAGPHPPVRLRLDLTCCSAINVDGMLALSVAQEAARVRGGDLLLVQVPPLIARQLRQHNFDGLVRDATTEPR